uniref:Uncharacterized protein n=1 Tax=Ornithorhynchus anatinus TaxID=9258 RepID=A0A6I8NES1_ORNAN
MEAVPRMPMIWLDLKEAGDFGFQPAVKKVRGRGAPPPSVDALPPRPAPPLTRPRLFLPSLPRGSLSLVIP